MYVGSDRYSYYVTANLTKFFGHPLTTPFRLPQSIHDKVEIEPLKNAPYAPLDPSQPIYGIYETPHEIGWKNCQKIVGYREIFMKRERITFLHFLIQDTIPPKINQKNPKEIPYDTCCGDCHCGYETDHLFFDLPNGAAAQIQIRNENQLAVGGWGGGNKGQQRNRKPSNSRKGNKCKKCKKIGQCFKKKKKPKYQNKAKKPRCKICKKKNAKAKPKKPEKPLTPKQRAAKAKKDEKERVKNLKGDAKRRESQFSVVEPSNDKCEKEQDFEEPKPEFGQAILVEQERKRAIKGKKMIVRQLSLGSHLMVLIQGNQKDNEWLQLSASSDQEVETEKVRRKRIKKDHEVWMDSAINYASQKMFRSLIFFVFLLNISIRNPFTIQPCYRNQIVMVHIFRVRMFLFSFSTLVLWFCLCFIVINALQLHYGGAEEEDHYLKMEVDELTLYYVFFWGFTINLFLAALWSLLVLLHYCLVISNYYNLWSKSMPFLAMNPVFGINSYIKGHCIGYVIYCIVLSVSFAVDWPIVTRGTFGQVFVLIFRQMFPRVRMLSQKYFFWGELGCFLLYLYCVWINRTLFMFLHQFSLLLRNACQQWNLNLALRFQLVVTYYRAHLLRVGSQGSLFNLYNQHRIIVGLCNYYGLTFMHPLFVYMVTNMGVVTMIMIFFIKYEEIDPATFDNVFTLNLQSEKTDAVIYHTLPKQDELTGVVFILIMCCVDFIQGTIGIGWGSQAMVNSFEFVRRVGLLQCNSRHERRFIHSLFISFSDTCAPTITANGYFGITRRNIFIGLMSMAFFWTMIIQCQVEQPSALIEWVPFSTGKCEGLRMYEDVRGGTYCMHSHKFRNKMKNRLKRNRMATVNKLNAFDTSTRYLFRSDCERQELIDDQARINPSGLGMCKVTNINMDMDKFARTFPRSLDQNSFEQYSSVWERSRIGSGEWKAPKDKMYQTESVYPCDVKNGKFTWKDFQRDFYRVCWSRVLKVDVILSVVFHRHSGSDEPARPVDIETFSGLKDCGINPYVDHEEANYVSCNGDPITLDDCGSPNTPDFFVDSLNPLGVFRRVRLKNFIIPNPLIPVNYKENGFSDFGTVRCWDSAVASEKCQNSDSLKYCKISKRRGVTKHGYLYGKNCYDFVYFAVFVPPEPTLFCLHPRNDDATLFPPWVDEDVYDRELKHFDSLIKDAVPAVGGRGIMSLLNSTSNATIKSSIRKKFKSIKSKELKLKEFMDRAEKTSIEKKGHPLGILGRGLVRQTISAKARKSQDWRVTYGRGSAGDKYKSNDAHPRVDLFDHNFPCKDGDSRIQGWLPLPHVVTESLQDGEDGKKVMRPDAKRTPVDLKELMAAWKGGDCWEDPYPAAVFKKFPLIHAVEDFYGNKILDDCFTPWWSSDPEVFIPDDVFSITEVKMVRENDTLPACWDANHAAEKCDKSDCRRPQKG